METIIFIGAQASGKSTFYQQRFRDSHVRINLDMLKTRNREAILFEACLRALQPVVVDNTNPTAEDRQRYIGPAKQAGFRVVGYYFSSRIQELLQRNSQRPEGSRIPEKGILGTYGRLERPALREGFDELFYVKDDGQGGFIAERWNDEI